MYTNCLFSQIPFQFHCSLGDLSTVVKPLEPHWAHVRKPARLLSTAFHMALESTLSNQVQFGTPWAVTHSTDLSVGLVVLVCLLLLQHEAFQPLIFHQFQALGHVSLHIFGLNGQLPDSCQTVYDQPVSRDLVSGRC